MTRGDELTVAHLLEFLAARGHRVDLVSIKGKGERLRPEHQRWLEAHCRSVRLVEQVRGSPRSGRGLGVLRGWPFQIGYFYVPAQLAAAASSPVERRLRSGLCLRHQKRRGSAPDGADTGPGSSPCRCRRP